MADSPTRGASYLQSYTTDSYSTHLSLEIAVLQQDVKLPSISLDPITYDILKQQHSNTYDDKGKIVKYATPYTMPYQVCTNVIGYFRIFMITPLVENGDPTKLKCNTPKVQQINRGINGKSYTEQNYIPLMIPKFLALNFYKYPDYTNFTNDGIYYTGEYQQVIPKGTKFLCSFVGGSIDMNNISIIGICGESLNVSDTVLEVK